MACLCRLLCGRRAMFNILTINLVLSTFVFWVAAKLYVLPKLDDCEPRTILLPILLLHSLRHLGLMFLAPGSASSCHKWGAYLVFPYKLSGSRCIEELNGFSPLEPTPRREKRKEPTCYDGFCGARLLPSSELGTMTPAICRR